MLEASATSLRAVFENLPEGRKAKGRVYPQWLILSLMTLAKLCGYHAYAEMARFVCNHPELLALLGFTRSDLPCDDTFRYVLRHLDPVSLDKVMAQWAQQELATLQALSDEPPSLCAYAADGKTLRGSRDELHGQKAVHQLYHTVVAQQPVAEKRNEIDAAKTLFESMSLAGMVITADALLTQKGITAVIDQRQGRYLLVLKDNHRQAKEFLVEPFHKDLPPPGGYDRTPQQRGAQGLV